MKYIFEVIFFIWSIMLTKNMIPKCSYFEITNEYDCIDNRCFKFEEIKKIIVPPSIKNVIGDGCFEYCHNLVELNLLYDIEKVQTNMFRFCTSLRSVTLSKSIKYISFGAFANCKSLEKVIIKSNAIQINHNAFSQITFESVDDDWKRIKITSDENEKFHGIILVMPIKDFKIEKKRVFVFGSFEPIINIE